MLNFQEFLEVGLNLKEMELYSPVNNRSKMEELRQIGEGISLLLY